MSAGNAGGAVMRWSADDLRRERAQRGDVLVVDVRTVDARTLNPWQIPGAHWIPLADVAQRTGTLPRAATIVTYCT